MIKLNKANKDIFRYILEYVIMSVQVKQYDWI
jgi:hypothetical protein